MKKTNMKSCFVCAVLALPCVSSFAVSGYELANTKDCFSCHSVDYKVIGPAYKDVAAKYAGNRNAEEALIKKVMHGGSGVWGSARMPANTQVNEVEARRLVEWVLSQGQAQAQAAK
jgi:cytochrome c